jgi:L-threonylcarbamoyladenylate synthase
VSQSERGSASLFEESALTRIDATRTNSVRVVDDVASAIFAGKTVVFPTDTVYGLGCDPKRAEAVARVRGVAGGAEPLVLHLGSVVEALEHCGRHIRNFATIRRLLPGAVTVIIERPAFIDPLVSAGLPVLGLRVPDDLLSQAILERCGPLATTTARRNAQGTWSAGDLFIDNGPVRSLGEATVLDLTAERPRLVREGVVTMETLEQMIGRIDPPLGRVR